MRARRRQPRQRDSGARIERYRCCLPALAGFSIYRRGGRGGALARCLEWHRARRWAHGHGWPGRKVFQGRLLALPKRAAAPPAWLRRPNRTIPLLPSGPGGVFDLSSRRRQRGHHEL